MIAMFQYFFYTLLMELPILIVCYINEWKKILVIGILLNLFTWPLLTLLYFYTDIHLLFLELGVLIIEAIGFRIFLNTSLKKSFLVSFLANGLSLLIAVILNGVSIVY